MALTPCEATGHRYTGKACRAYVAIISRGNKWEHKPRLCSGHFNALCTVFELVGGEISAAEPDSYSLGQCLVCREDVEDQMAAAVFMTTYGQKGDRADWYAALHETCQTKAQELIRNP